MLDRDEHNMDSENGGSVFRTTLLSNILTHICTQPVSLCKWKLSETLSISAYPVSVCIVLTILISHLSSPR